MKKYGLLFVIFILLYSISFSKQFYEMTNFEIDSLLQKISSKNLTITERMNIYSKYFLGMPYNFKCVGDGPYALYEPYPLVNFKETNCMSFCEHVLALSISDSWDNFFNNLQHIRYKDGIIGMRTRNHYTMGDWIIENSWLLDDITKKIGKNYAKKLTKTISHKKFFEKKGIKDLRYVKPDRKITIYYIPFDKLIDLKNEFKTGDILSLIFKNKEGIFSAHMLMVMEYNGIKVIRESAMSKKTTFDTPFEKWVEKYLNSEKYAGVSIMRVKDALNKKGKIILPWEIQKMKK